MRVIGPNMHHPGSHDREGGSRVELAIDRGLKSGKLDIVELSQDDLLDLAARALECVRVLRRSGEDA